MPLWLADDLAGDAHAVEQGHVEDDGDGARVEGLRAVRPEVGALRRVDVPGAERGLHGGRKEVRDGEILLFELLGPVAKYVTF